MTEPQDSTLEPVDDLAATKIQASFRGYRVRKEHQKKIQEQHDAAAKIQRVYRGFSTREIITQTKADEGKAAVKIQRVFRGHKGREQVRDEMKKRDPTVDVHEECGPVETTLAMIKPDAVKKGFAQAVKDRIQREGFVIVREKFTKLTLSTAQLFYKEHEQKSFFEKLTKFMSSGPIYVMILARVNAITAWRNLIGPTNPIEAKKKNPSSIRALYGDTENTTMNAVHGSDSRASAEREAQFFFTNQLAVPRNVSENPRSKVQSTVLPTLTQGLAELVKNKPAEPLMWLADWLLVHNPNKPKVN